MSIGLHRWGTLAPTHDEPARSFTKCGCRGAYNARHAVMARTRVRSPAKAAAARQRSPRGTQSTFRNHHQRGDRRASISGTSGGAVCAALIRYAYMKGERPVWNRLIGLWQENATPGSVEHAFNRTIIGSARMINSGALPVFQVSPSSPLIRSDFEYFHVEQDMDLHRTTERSSRRHDRGRRFQLYRQGTLR